MRGEEKTDAEQEFLSGGRAAASFVQLCTASFVEVQERPPRGASAAASKDQGGSGQLQDGDARDESTKQTPRRSQQ